mmetsp:Transcript_8066/g.9268  ORF Transcript_8066/g.9268 Transcript_8066/m.9268 type:complete len:135 (+) Transcript_8066:57-461(+)
MSSNTPEDRYHPRKQTPINTKYANTMRDKKLLGRVSNYFDSRIWRQTPLNSFIERHQQRRNLAPYMASFLFFYYLGTLGHYYCFRRYVIEDKWVEEYGQDVPHWRKYAPFHWMQRVRAEYIHFYRYRLFYFIEE